MQKRFAPDEGGVFPEWEEVTLGDIAKFSRGKGLTKKDVFKKGKRKCLLYGQLQVRYGTVIKNVTGMTDVELKNPVLSKSGDVLISGTISAGLAKASCIKEDDVIIGGDINILRPKEGIDGEFLARVINANAKKFKRFLEGSVILHLKNENIKDVSIRIPKSIEEQRKIAAALAAYDDMITVKTAKLETWQECKKRMVKEIFDRTKRFKNDDGNEFPEWEEKTLGDVAEILKNNVNPQNNKNDFFTEYSMPAYDNEQTAEVMLGAAMKSSRKKMTKPVVLVNKLNVRKKRVWKVSNPESNAVCSAEFVPLASDDMDLDFLQQLCETDGFTKYLMKNTTGTANSLQRVRPEVITDYTFKMPCMEEQQKIGSFLAAIDKEIQIQKEFIKTYAEGKKRMMKELME